jgi:RNA polymerase-associated protein CTR9
MSNRPSLLIPVRGSDENVEVFTDELPEDADDILAILQAEIAPLDIWLKFAVCPF